MEKRDPWYADGLKFACRQCGGCCGGAPGFVWVTNEEIKAMAKEMGLTVAAFEAAFVRLIRPGKKSLNEREDGDCVLLNEQTRRCVLYESRPTQCRTWPFWDQNLTSEKRWKNVAKSCPGCDRPDGRLYSLEEIEKQKNERF